MTDILTPSKHISLVSLNSIGTRPEPIVPDGVWIEIQGSCIENEAVNNAINEEERVKTMLHVKQEQLKNFQRDVQRRVALATQVHKKFVMDSQNIKMEKERKLLLRSASAAELSSPKKNRCTYNVNPIIISDGIRKIKNDDGPENFPNHSLGDPTLQICQNSSVNNPGYVIRKQLADRTTSSVDSKQSQKDGCLNCYHSLPGGLWGTGPASNKPLHLLDHVSPVTCTREEEETIETVPASVESDDMILTSMQESIAASSCATRNNDSQLFADNTQCSLLNVKPNVHFKLLEDSSVSKNTLTNSMEGEANPLVKCCLPSNANHGSRYCGDVTNSLKQNLCLNDNNKEASPMFNAPPLVKPGAFAYNLKLADKRAKWLSRRIFSDAERERTKEQMRWKEHQKRVARLKEEKEKERAEVEEKSREQIEAVQRAKEQLLLENEIKLNQEKIKKEKMLKKRQKTERFVAALHSQLRERIALNKIELPPLCMCAPSFWDTDPLTCATNCLFHHNHKAYTKALEAVLSIVERNTRPPYKDLQKSAVSLGLVVEDLSDNDNEGNCGRSPIVLSEASSDFTCESFLKNA